MIRSERVIRVLLAAGLCLAAAGSAFAADSPLSHAGPVAEHFAVPSAASLPVYKAQALDRAAALAEDKSLELADAPPRFALPEIVDITPATDGVWHELDPRWVMWRLRIDAPGALSVNLGFDRFRLPKNSRLTVYPADARSADAQSAGDPRGVHVFTERDNEVHGQLWTPILQADDIVVELVLPAASRDDYELRLTSVNRGYRAFGAGLAREAADQDAADKAGDCNIDVVCPEGDDWRVEISSVGVYTVNGTWYCSGAMINNTAQDERPLFLTANHCGLSAANDQGVIIYWNFESPVCGQQSGGSLLQFNSGVIFRVAYAGSDVCLVELEEPLDPAFQVAYSGWDRTGADMSSAVAIHHPSTDEKSISFEYDPTTTTSYLGTAVPGDGTHIRITDWDLGTTEPGSSGSPLYSPEHRIVGQLHGGYAACGNDLSDWYGKMSVSWVNGLAAYLDPLGTGATTLDTFAPWQQGLVVSGGSLVSEGDVGGPFTPADKSFTVGNNAASAIDYAVSANVGWIDLSTTGGTLPAGAEETVTVSLNAVAATLGIGTYTGTVSFTNLTDGEGSAERSVSLQVGVPGVVYSWNFDTNPGWTADTGWAFGVPLGGGGAEHGNADPTSGYTGTNVYGYNLAGDYTSNLPERHLTTTAIDCSDLTAVSLRFRRWLNVEQPTYDHAYVRVSTDGTTWTQVWTNGGEITDSAWQAVEFDISAIADNQGTVYVRWTMGTTDGSWEYAGWNVDDVEIWGLQDYVSAVGDLPGRALAVGNHPNPFNPLTKISFSLDRDGYASLDVYDMQGRRVRHLVGEVLAAGDHSIVWDGQDDAGRQVGSGVYFAKLVAGGATADHKMVLLK